MADDQLALLSVGVPSSLQAASKDAGLKVIEADCVEAIAEIRGKLRDGEAISFKDMQMIVVYLRDFRVAAHTRNKKVTKKRAVAKKVKTIKNDVGMQEDLVKQLDEL